MSKEKMFKFYFLFIIAFSLFAGTFFIAAENNFVGDSKKEILLTNVKSLIKDEKENENEEEFKFLEEADNLDVIKYDHKYYRDSNYTSPPIQELSNEKNILAKEKKMSVNTSDPGDKKYTSNEEILDRKKVIIKDTQFLRMPITAKESYKPEKFMKKKENYKVSSESSTRKEMSYREIITLNNGVKDNTFYKNYQLMFMDSLKDDQSKQKFFNYIVKKIKEKQKKINKYEKEIKKLEKIIQKKSKKSSNVFLKSIESFFIKIKRFFNKIVDLLKKKTDHTKYNSIKNNIQDNINNKIIEVPNKEENFNKENLVKENKNKIQNSKGDDGKGRQGVINETNEVNEYNFLSLMENVNGFNLNETFDIFNLTNMLDVNSEVPSEVLKSFDTSKYKNFKENFVIFLPKEESKLIEVKESLKKAKKQILFLEKLKLALLDESFVKFFSHF